MKALIFSFKRLLVTPWFSVFLLLVLIAPVFARRAAADVAVPSPVYAVSEEADADAARLSALLDEAGFVRRESAEAVYEAVAAGDADAGLILPGRLSASLREGSTGSLIRFIKSPNALLPDLWQEHAAAALFSVYAPYIMADALDGSGLSEEEILHAYYENIGAGTLFSFEILNEKGRVNAFTDRQERFFTGAISLLLFASVFYVAAEPLYDETRRLAARTGKKKAVQNLLLPGALVRSLLFWLAASAAALICGRPDIVLPLLLYILLLLIFGLILKALPGQNWQGLFCLFLLLTSLAVCPIYTDLSLIIPLLARLRVFLPPYWLWMMV